jgi:ubiquinone/menaquinone biosynthesis C-methylase UbiE
MDDITRSDRHKQVQHYYGEALSSSKDLKTTACCTAAAPSTYLADALDTVHQEVRDRYYGCGLVLPEALEGLRVLDLGCGAGRDVYVLSKLVGSSGRVVGVDMTPAQLSVANAHLDWHMQAFGYKQPNVEFIEANIEQLDQTSLPNDSFDLIVSNCVINLAVDKAAVLQSAYRLLSPGGEMYFSDIYADRRVPTELLSDPVLYGECLSGALYWQDFIQLARSTGFADPRLVEFEPVEVTDKKLADRTGPLRFVSATCRLFKAEGLEQTQEDYGEAVVYRGTIAEQPDALRLDCGQTFPAGEKVPVSGNTAQILRSSRFYKHFDIYGDRSKHIGEFRGISKPELFADISCAAKASRCC